MKDLVHCHASGAHPTNAELAGALGKSLDRKYSRVLQSARQQWERSFPGKDPSDACVSVRISKHTLRQGRSRLRGALSYGL